MENDEPSKTRFVDVMRQDTVSLFKKTQKKKGEKKKKTEQKMMKTSEEKININKS